MQPMLLRSNQRLPMIRKATFTLILAVALAGIYIQKSYGTKFEGLLTGEQVPLSFQLQNLDSSWRKMAISGQSESGDYIRSYYNLLIKSAINFVGSPGNINVYFTQGRTVKIGRETYLIAYHVPVKPIGFNLQSIMEKRFACAIAAAEPLNPETPLTLSFLNVRTIGSLNDVSAFDLDQELAASKQTAEKAQALCEQSQQNTTEPDRDSSEVHLTALYAALIGYTEAHEGLLPNMADADTVKQQLQDWVNSETTFIQPETEEPYQPNASLSEKTLAQIPNPEEIVAFYEAKVSEDGTIGVVFLDGTFERISAEDWPQVKHQSGLP
jgi:hypothetical protein